MSDLKQEGFKSGDLLAQLGAGIDALSEAEKKAQIKKINIKNAQGKEATWVIDLKDQGKVTRSTTKKPDVTMNLSDDTFAQLADGKLNGQKAFMTGALKVKGNAPHPAGSLSLTKQTKLDGVLKSAKAKL